MEVTQGEVTILRFGTSRKKATDSTVFGMQGSEQTQLANMDTTFQLGDQVAVVGDEEEIARIAGVMGKVLPFTGCPMTAPNTTPAAFSSPTPRSPANGWYAQPQ